MIAYTEKGSGLHAAIRKAGYQLHQENGVWVASDDIAVQAVIDAFSPLTAEIEAKKSAIDELAAAKRDRIVGDVSPAEMAKWQEKYRQSKAYKLTPDNASAPDIATEAAARGVGTDQLATRIITKGDQLSYIEAMIAGASGKHADTVSAMTDWRAVQAYDFSQGWPV